MFPFRSTAILGVLLAAGSHAATLKDDPDVDIEELTEQVQEIAEAREKQRIAYLTSVRKDLIAAIKGSGNAGNYMIECMREIRFGGKKGGNADYADWKKENRNLFSDRDFEKASELHLKYLLLTLERGTLESSEPMINKVWRYLYELDAAKETLAFIDKPSREIKIRVVNEQQEVVSQMVGDMQALQQPSVRGRAGPGEVHQYVEEFLTTPVDSGFPGQALKLQGRMGNLGNWCMTPGDYAGILESNVRPILRENADPTLLWTWDEEIGYLRDVAKLSKDQRNVDEFEKEILPRLLWKKAQDAEKIGFPNKALKMEIEIAKKYPGHKDFENWTAKIDERIKEIAKEADQPETGKITSATDPQGFVGATEIADEQSDVETDETMSATESEGFFGTARNPTIALPTPSPVPEPSLF